jgi:hypothetical protein
MGRRFCLLAVIIAIGLATSSSAQTPALLLFGGTNHKTFLGCLNCSKYDSASVCNKSPPNGNGHQNLIAQPGTSCPIEFRLIQLRKPALNLSDAVRHPCSVVSALVMIPEKEVADGS